MGPTDSVNSHRFDSVLLNGFAALHHDEWNVDIISAHLFSKVDTERRSPLVNPICTVVGGLYTL